MSLGGVWTRASPSTPLARGVEPRPQDSATRLWAARGSLGPPQAIGARAKSLRECFEKNRTSPKSLGSPGGAWRSPSPRPPPPPPLPCLPPCCRRRRRRLRCGHLLTRTEVRFTSQSALATPRGLDPLDRLLPGLPSGRLRMHTTGRPLRKWTGSACSRLTRRFCRSKWDHSTEISTLSARATWYSTSLPLPVSRARCGSTQPLPSITFCNPHC
mmetsp:Transcript_3091/g.7596  ORF Transcript_3091/g.7596 Transcript_3091/m.7596 type:complete len:214 (+) Transcript_3091:748-1389(+)